MAGPGRIAQLKGLHKLERSIKKNSQTVAKKPYHLAVWG